MAHQWLLKLRYVNRMIAWLVGILLLTCAAVVLIDIVLRQVGSSFGGTDEISGYVMAIATSWGMAYTLLELGHIRIDLIRSRGTTFIKALFDIFCMIVTSGTIVFIAIKAWPVVERSLSNGSRANTPLETPLAWVQMPWFLGWVWFAVMSCTLTLLALSLLVKGRASETEPMIGAFAEQDMLQ
jgi:TRAP-type C4-dicarboxylate transport system permease small subunit